MDIWDQRRNAWVLEVPPHGTVILHPQAPTTSVFGVAGVSFHVRLYNLEKDTPHILTCEGRKLGTVRSDSAGSIQNRIVLRGECSQFLGKVLTFEREGCSPLQIAAGVLERDI